MNNEYNKFVKKTDDLLTLLLFMKEATVPEELEFIYSDFYLKNIISNNYTNFENYIRSCLTIIADSLSGCEKLDKDLISEELRYDIIGKCLSRFPTSNINNRVYNDDKKIAASNLNDILNKEMYIFKLEEHSFVQLPHSIAELEKLLCKYFNKKRILHDIKLTTCQCAMKGLELVSIESAFAFLNKYVKELRHPIVHQGINLYMNENIQISVTDDYAIEVLNNFKFIVSHLNEIFNNYYQQLIEYQTDYEDRSEEINFDELVEQ